MENNGMNTPVTGLWILGGFLGSGKTTLLNNLLAGMSDKRIGVVVNDFGTLPVDAGLVRGSGKDDVIELSGGQIFCTCLSGSFVHSIERLAAHGLDAIIVESSGLAKPSALADIIDQARKSTGDGISYRGFIAVVDAERFSRLVQVVNAVEEQVYYADLVVINKTDLVSSVELSRVKAAVKEINGSCRTLETVRASTDPADLPGAPLHRETAETERYAGWGGHGRPKAVTWKPERLLSENELQSAVRLVSETAYRIKGYLTTKEGPRFVNASGSQISIEPVSNGWKEEGLSVIVPPRVVTTKLFARAEEEAGAR